MTLLHAFANGFSQTLHAVAWLIGAGAVVLMVILFVGMLASALDL